MKSTIHRALAWLMLMLVGMQFAAAQMPVPEAGHRVTDLAQVLNVSDTENLARQLEGLEARTRAQVGILIVPTLQQEPIEGFSQRVFNSWGLGRAGVNDGMLMVLSVQDRKVRIHVGRGLDGTFPESVVTRIIRERMGPAFREKQYATGFSRAIEAISGPIAEHSQITPSASANLSNEVLSAAAAQPSVPVPATQSSSNIGWAVFAVAAGVACIVFVAIGVQRQAKRKAREAAEQAAARERDEMRRRALQESEDAYRAAQERERMAAARAREERAVQNNAASARSTASARSASSYPSLRSVSSSTSSSSGRTTSNSSSSRTSSSNSPSRPSLSKSSSSSFSSSSSRRSSSRDDDDYSRRSAASWTPSVSSSESSSSSNSSSWSGGDSGGGGGGGDY